MPRPRIAAVVVVIAVVAAIVAGVWIERPNGSVRITAAAQTAVINPHPKILFVGDSMSDNLFSTTPAQGYRELLTKRLGGTQAEYVGHSGITSGQGATLLEPTRVTGADLVVVELGTNDAYQHVPLTTTTVDYDHVLQLAVARARPGATLICVGTWGDIATLPALDDVLSSACTAAGGVFVRVRDLYPVPAYHGPFGSPSYLGPRDLFHPNDAGHSAIAERIAQHVRVRH